MSDTAVQNEPNSTQGSTPSAPQSAPAPDDAHPQAKKTALSGEIAFNDSISVYAGNPLPQYDKGPVKAYIALGRDKAPAKLFAMVCEDHLTPRISKALNYVSILNPAMPRLVASGVIDWKPAGKEKYCFIYENTLGQCLMKDDTRGGLGLKPELVVNSIIRPMISVLQDLRDKDIVHGNIRPSNMFDGGMRNLERIVLGECLVLPPSYNQQALYEPIDRALCTPSGRGTGTLQDDLYSFGVSLAVLLRHYDPLEGLSEEEVLDRKMEEGSYITLLAKDRLSGAILELLRGLLYDDESQRWTLDDVMVWMDGRRLSPKQAARRSKASRPLSFNGEKYFRPELLARDLNKNVSEAGHLIESGEIEQWLMRALEDKAMLAKYQKVMKQVEDNGAGKVESAITCTAMVLHPEGPIRYKNISINPDGVGTAFTESFMQKRDIQTYHDFFINYFISQWIDAQTKTVSDVGSLIFKFDSARAFLRQKGLGGGIEKCIYTLNPEVHCLSEKLSKYHVRTPEDMMHAFEKISKLPSRPALFFDRHIVAFLSVKDRKNIDPYIHDMNAPELYKRILAEVKTLATIQKRSQMGKFPGITSWIFDMLDPIYERFHDRQLRTELKRKAEKLKETGDIVKMITLFDMPEVYQQDNLNFRKAMREHYDLEQEEAGIERDLKNEKSMGQDTGRQYASLFSAILAGVLIFAAIVMGLKENSIF